ncbi:MULTISPECIES: hypothetical protein [Calothrix]|uniref:Uncharacterized protein n=2 Tax=Calothrix TaxID=1186 RepID=A0ABR8ACJ5_9CYAN|nr:MULTISPECIES: hypothetical protein [Calothrix]MBD2197735.1 hypothetical protein [Calothrix parietina FACHB-288]MBD2225664.1 hypothetical protein [Calothrix anomala FACHB-343]
MIERPIKKSERQAQANTDKNSENSADLQPESNPRSSKSKGNRSSGKGKKSSFGEETKQQVSPALVRGPKPVKPKVDLKAETETEAEPSAEESQDS